MAKIIPFTTEMSLHSYLLLILQTAKHDPESAMDSISHFLLARKDKLNRLSYLTGVCHGALMKQIRPDAITHIIPEIVEKYARNQNPR